jgi:hypothetical protein
MESSADDQHSQEGSEMDQENGGYEDDTEDAMSSEGEDFFRKSSSGPGFQTGDGTLSGISNRILKVRVLNPVLPETVTVLDHPSSGGRVYIVGTAHFGTKSQEDVATTIRQVGWSND